MIITEVQIIQTGPPGPNTVAGLIEAGANVTLSGDGTLASPLVISATGGGGGGTGTVESVAMTVPTGLVVTGSPITTSGTLAVSLAAGYVIPTQATLDGKQPLAAVLTNTTASFTTTLETKLNGIAAGATANTGTVTSVAITGAGGISFTGSPITTSGTFTMSIDAPALRTTLGVAPAPTSGNATTGQTVLGDDTRLSDARSPLAHGHAISDITGLSDGLGTISVLNASIAGVFTFAFGVSYAYQTGAAADHRRALAGDSIVTEAADFTLSEATHGSRYTRLTKTGSTQVITLPTDPTAPDFTTGAEFGFYRATTQALAFSGGTVNGAANLASVPVNGAFALKYLGSGTYDFI